jgi:hypothetical protein
MGKRFTQVKLNAFKEIQVEAGVILKAFDPSNPVLDRANIVCVTTGGITINAKPTYTDYFEDVDNVPNNTKEGKQLDSWECSIATTALDTSAESLRLELGAADIDETDTNRVTPRNYVKLTDFADLWWVGDRADGGLVACQILNALSTDGFSLKTTKKGKGTTALTLTGHYSLDAVDTVPMNFYVIEGDSESNSIVLDKASATVVEGNDVTITATTVPDNATVTWQSLDTSVATVVGGVVTGQAEGETIIIASFIDSNDKTYLATCAISVTAAEVEQGEG